MVGVYWLRRRLAPTALGLATIMAVGCQDRLPTAEPESQATIGLDVVSGGGQQGYAGEELPIAVVVRVTSTKTVGTDKKVTPVVGVPVNFVVTQGGGSFYAGATLTDQDGYASDYWTLGPAVGTQTAEARAVTGQTGTRSVYGGFSATAVSGGFVSLSAGSYHTCGIRRGTVYCWGDNSSGELGNGTTTRSTTPVAISAPAGATFASVSAGTNHTCAVATNGTAYCWGINYHGELGDGTTTGRSAPVAVSVPVPGLAFATVSAGNEHTCGLTSTGAAYCWGDNTYGQLGNGTWYGTRSTPVAVSEGITFAQVSAGLLATCGVTTTNGGLYCWGLNFYGELGVGSDAGPETCSGYACSTKPAWIRDGFATVNTFRLHACAMDAYGVTWCWGYNSEGELGNGYGGSSPGPQTCSNNACAKYPFPVSSYVRFTAVSAGDYSSCGISADGGAYCWGSNNLGQLGNGSITESDLPIAVSGGLKFASLSVGSDHACGLTTSGAAYCWGFNNSGQLGDGTTSSSYTPVLVSNP